jgi:hypothetical protein
MIAAIFHLWLGGFVATLASVYVSALSRGDALITKDVVGALGWPVLFAWLIVDLRGPRR